MTAKEWIDKGGSFKEGIELADALGIKDKALELARRLSIVTAADKSRLRRLLQPYAQSSTQHSSLPVPTSSSIPDATHPVITQLRSDAKALHKKQDHLRGKLHSEEYPSARYEIVVELMEDVIPSLDHIYSQIQHYQDTGELPTVSQGDIVQETVQKMLRIQSLNSRISRLRSKLKKENLSNTEQSKYEKELLEKEAELTVLKSELNLT
jgi:hypothetical protein